MPLLRKLTTPLHLVLSSLVFTLFVAWILPGYQAELNAVRGDVPPPDLRILYTPDTLRQVFSAWGPELTADYVRARYTFDLYWPLGYTYFYLAWLGFCVRGLCDQDSPWPDRAILGSLAPLAFDLIENACVVGFYYTDIDGLAWLAGLATPLKWASTGVLSAAWSGALIALGYKRLMGAKSKAA